MAAFEKLPRNKKLLVFAGALSVAGLLWYESKKKGEKTEGEESEGDTASATSSEGEPAGDEGLYPTTAQEYDPGSLGGFGGSAPLTPAATTDAAGSVTNADGTVPSIPTGGGNTQSGGIQGGQTVQAGGIGEQNILGENDIGQQDVTGGGAPVTPHAAAAHLPSKSKKAAHKAAKKPTHKAPAKKAKKAPAKHAAAKKAAAKKAPARKPAPKKPAKRRR